MVIVIIFALIVIWFMLSIKYHGRSYRSFSPILKKTHENWTIDSHLHALRPLSSKYTLDNSENLYGVFKIEGNRGIHLNVNMAPYPPVDIYKWNNGEIGELVKSFHNVRELRSGSDIKFPNGSYVMIMYHLGEPSITWMRNIEVWEAPFMKSNKMYYEYENQCGDGYGDENELELYPPSNSVRRFIHQYDCMEGDRFIIENGDDNFISDGIVIDDVYISTSTKFKVIETHMNVCKSSNLNRIRVIPIID